MMTYPEAVQYLESFTNYERQTGYSYRQSFKLERIRLFLNLIGNPQYKLRCIHIAGTKGKGSTAAIVAYILKEFGYKVGLYTSPHLSDFRERIRILIPNNEHDPDHGLSIPANNEFEGMISESSICKIISRLKPAIDKFNKNLEYGHLTFFEIYTSIAFLYFCHKNTDFIVLETGLGGRLDATNVVEPLVVGITPISLEHTRLLGNSLTEIAKEKAAIIKASQPAAQPVRRSKNRGWQIEQAADSRASIVISAPQENGVKGIIRRRCRDTGAKLYEIGKDIDLGRVTNNLSGSSFSVKGIFNSYNNLKIKLLGRHQVVNAALALGIIESLRFYNIIISKKGIRKGLAHAAWPGRFEVVRRKPLIVLDGAQNKASSIALRNTLKSIFKKKIILILGVSQDKDIKGMLSALLPIAKKAVFTKSNNPRAMAPDEIMSHLKCGIQKVKKVVPNYYMTYDVKSALSLAKQNATKDDLILVTGSLFVVGEARQIVYYSN